jgi:hypothetical protein
VRFGITIDSNTFKYLLYADDQILIREIKDNVQRGVQVYIEPKCNISQFNSIYKQNKDNGY